MYRSHVVSLQCAVQDGPAHTPHLSPRSPASTRPSSPVGGLLPAGGTHSDRPGTPGTLQKKKKTPSWRSPSSIQHPASSIQTRQRRIRSRFPEAPHKIYEPYRRRLSLPIPIFFHVHCTYCAHWPGWTAGLPASCYVGLQVQIIHKYCTGTHLHCMCSCRVAASLLFSPQP